MKSNRFPAPANGSNTGSSLGTKLYHDLKASELLKGSVVV
jgi:hypothetical protein